MSHPVWVRGLKLYSCWYITHACYVAPRVGAWIETRPHQIQKNQGAVAPRVGAWIETSVSCPCLTNKSVAPRVGAWIETEVSKGTRVDL